MEGTFRPPSRGSLSTPVAFAAIWFCLAAAWRPAAEQALPALGEGPGLALPPLPKPTPTPKPLSVKSLFPAPWEDAATSATPRSSAPYFRIGYMRPTEESPLGREWYQSMRRRLLSDPAFRQAMIAPGLSGVHLRPCDGPEDMLQRMGQAEFDLVFCPAMVYAGERIAHPERYAEGEASPDRYLVVFRTERRADRGDSHSSRHVRRFGVLFVRGNVETENVADLLNQSSQVLAVSGSYDAAGYFYALKILREKYDGCSPRVLFCGSPQNVVKSVVSGLCDVGACEESVLNEVLGALPSARAGVDFASDENPYVRVVERTIGVPTDPVVMRAAYDPGLNGSPLGAAARDVIRRLHLREEKAPSLLPPGEDDRAYEAMVEDMKKWRE